MVQSVSDFLNQKREGHSVGAFVKSAFKSYSKSKEKLDSHESADYHKKAEECGLYAKTQLQNIANRIDVQYCPISSMLCTYAQYSRFLLEKR